MRETQVWCLVQEGPLEKEMAPTLVFLLGKPHGTWHATVHGVAKSQIQFSNWTAIKADNPVPWGCSHLLKWLTLCGVCISLNKSTSYLSHCLSLNYFRDKTSRTQASFSPEPGVWSQLKDHRFKSQTESHGFQRGSDGMQVRGWRTSSWKAWVLPDHRVLVRRQILLWKAGACNQIVQVKSPCSSY